MICSHLGQNVTVAVARCQVQGCVVATVHDIDASPSHDEHVHDTWTTLTARPVQRTEPVIIPARNKHTPAHLESVIIITWILVKKFLFFFAYMFENNDKFLF